MVPEALRGAKEFHSSAFRYESLDAIFPGLGEAFESYEFRNRLREAGRLDLADRSPLVGDPQASVQGSWRRPSYDRLTAVLAPAGLTGEEFISTLAALRLLDDDDLPSSSRTRQQLSCHTGHWMDIVGVRRRRLQHSWHQDAHGDARQLTVTLAFPGADWDPATGTTGIFSHVLRLSHELKPTADSQTTFLPRNFADLPTMSDEDLIIRPLCKRNQEILISSDAMTLHSAPDIAHRDSLWRIM